MKKILYSALLFGSVCLGMASCSNGDYIANPSSNGNNSVNPLNPLKPGDFIWTGTAPLSLKINGSSWVADSVIYLVDSLGYNLILGIKNKKIQLYLHLQDTYADNLYNMGYNQYNRLGIWADSFGYSFSDSAYYFSALGNSGQLYMTQNDTDFYAGKFYFQGVNAMGQVINISDGFMKIPKD